MSSGTNTVVSSWDFSQIISPSPVNALGCHRGADGDGESGQSWGSLGGCGNPTLWGASALWLPTSDTHGDICRLRF